jgi:RNA polymerase sigma factor (sigma-70 family)
MNPHPVIHSELASQRALELRRQGGGTRRSSRRDAARNDFASPELVELVHAAVQNDAHAWESLVARFSPALRATARSYRLSPCDVEDVVQAAWASALTHIGSLREPEAISGWITVIARREALRTLEQRRRELPLDESMQLHHSGEPSPESVLIEAERHEAVHNAVGQLPTRQRTLLRALLGTGEPSYEELAAGLKVPIGSLGPTRQRALARLRRNPSLRAIAEDRT